MAGAGFGRRRGSTGTSAYDARDPDGQARPQPAEGILNAASHPFYLLPSPWHTGFHHQQRREILRDVGEMSPPCPVVARSRGERCRSPFESEKSRRQQSH